MSPRLSHATLPTLRPGVQRPGYDRADLPVGIVHLGLGAFVRAHLALYTEDVLASAPGPWCIAGMSLQRPDQRDRLGPQDGLYTALLRDGDRSAARIVGCLRRTMVAPEDPASVVASMAGADTRIVSLTVTEKGYCHNPAAGRLDLNHPDIRHDLEHRDMPRSAVGLLTAALDARRRAGRPAFTVLCCDNLPHNGRLLAGLVRDFAASTDDSLARWIEAEVAFPSSMVDRIVPAMTAADEADALALTGLIDAAPVSHEPFRQWVFEDRFGTPGRPAWESVGALPVSNVAPYEHMKLRLLNGAHSALAYLGFLAGKETVPTAIADPAVRRYLAALWDEIIPVVPPPPGVDLHRYTADLLARFANTAIQHRTAQIASDGSQKLPQRLLATVRERLGRGLPFPCLALAVAAWIRFVGGTDESGAPIEVRDPLAATLRRVLDEAGPEPHDRVAAISQVQDVFGTDLGEIPAFVDAVTLAYRGLLQRGARAMLSATGGDRESRASAP